MIDASAILIPALASYIITLVVAESDIMLPFRRAMRRLFAITGSSMLVRWVQLADGRWPVITDPRDTNPEFEKVTGNDPISCRLCVGFWVTLAVCLYVRELNPISILSTYGLAYALAKQERF